MYLAHHGIRGQRWGVRRYQNEDGTLTEAGRRRYDRDLANYNRNKKPSARLTAEEFQADPVRWVDEDAKDAQSAASNIRQMSDVGRDLNKTIHDSLKKEKKVDTSMFSDQELRDRINRINLERQYSDLISNSKSVERGQKIVDDVFKYVGSSAALLSAGLGIYMAVNKIRGG